MSNSVKYTYNGKTYRTIKELATYLGINSSTLAKRLSRGWALNTAIETPCIKNDSTLLSSNEVEYRGKSYKCLPELCKSLNLDYKYVYKRIVNQGYTIQEALDTPVTARSGRSFNFMGKHYKSIGEFCRENNLNETSFRYFMRIGLTLEEAASKCNTIANKKIAKDREIEYKNKRFKTKMDLLNSVESGVSYTAFTTRLKNDIPLEEALTKSIIHSGDNVPPTEFEYKGIKYDSMAELAKKHSLKPHILRHRLKKYNMPLDKALAMPVKEKPRKVIEYGDKTYTSLAEIAKEFNVPYGVLQMRLSRGLSIEDALAKYLIQCDGKTYNSLKELADVYGLNVRTLRYRVSKGMSLEEAVRNDLISYNGKSYTSLSKLAKEYNVSYRVLKYRLDKGMSISEALEN